MSIGIRRHEPLSRRATFWLLWQDHFPRSAALRLYAHKASHSIYRAPKVHRPFERQRSDSPKPDRIALMSVARQDGRAISDLDPRRSPCREKYPQACQTHPASHPISSAPCVLFMRINLGRTANFSLVLYKSFEIGIHPGKIHLRLKRGGEIWQRKSSR